MENNQTVLEQIIELGNAFNNRGIYFMEYFSKKKLIRSRIEYECELRLDKAMSLLVRQEITKEEYNTYKIKINNTKRYYIKLLSNV